MSRRPLKVTVFEARHQAKPCAESCGLDWLLPENQKLARETLERNFPGEVSLDFVNLAEPEAARKHTGMLERLQAEGLFLPVLIINGEVKISGYFDLRMFRDMVEVARELW